LPLISETKVYNGALARIERLGLKPVWLELQQALTGFTLLLAEQKDSNSGATVRRMIDAQLGSIEGWVKTTSGDVDWIKSRHLAQSRPCLGVEIQVSNRSDMLIVDVCHLKDRLAAGDIDAGVIVVPSDRTSVFLTDRVAKFSDALIAVTRAVAETLPLIVLGITHDGPGPALPKQKKR
jgi:hypothetical protein